MWSGAQNIINGIQANKLFSKYSHNNTVDHTLGIHEVDCSGFVNHILVTQHLMKPLEEVQTFLDSLEDVPKPTKLDPWPIHYVLFLSSSIPKKFWSSIDNARLLQPGDIIAYVTDNKKDLSSERGQHIMIVADNIKPIIKSSWIMVPIFDSTKTPHGFTDVRGKDGGIGQGTIGLDLDSSGAPCALKWSKDSKYVLRRKITMARVIEG